MSQQVGFPEVVFIAGRALNVYYAMLVDESVYQARPCIVCCSPPARPLIAYAVVIQDIGHHSTGTVLSYCETLVIQTL